MKKLILTRMESLPVSFLFEDEKLIELDAVSKNSSDLNSIYIGKVKNIVPNIQAAFVEYKKGRNGFLSLTPELAHLHQGDELVVQVTKAAVKSKDPVLSARPSLSGDFCAVSFGDSRIGYSSKFTKEQRMRLKEALHEKLLLLSNQFLQHKLGIVIRTNAGRGDVTTQQILSEAEKLTRQLVDMMTQAKNRTVYSCLYEPDSFWLLKYHQVHLDLTCEIITDQKDVQELLPTSRFYQDAAYPLTALYGLKAKLKEVLSNKVWLKSGGFLIIEETEALTVIDVNSGKNINGKDKEAMIVLLNCEAALESARQLRLRNISGIVIIDFVNCKDSAAFLSVLKDALKKDPVKTAFIDITPLGLVEITRKKVSAPLAEKLRKTDYYELLKL